MPLAGQQPTPDVVGVVRHDLAHAGERSVRVGVHGSPDDTE